jgi:hypothetical protein
MFEATRVGTFRASIPNGNFAVALSDVKVVQ